MVAVRPAWQRAGAGSAAVRAALRALDADHPLPGGTVRCPAAFGV